MFNLSYMENQNDIFYKILELYYELLAKGIDEEIILDKKISFQMVPKLGYPYTNEIKIVKKEGNYLLLAQHCGYIGSTGILPLHYTELILHRCKNKDHSLLDFLNIFYNRSLNIFFKSWEKYQLFHLYRKHSFICKNKDPLSNILNAVVGNKLITDNQIYANVSLRYAGIFSRKSRTGWLLKCIIKSYFNLDITILQFQKKLFKLQTEQAKLLVTKLGTKKTLLGTTIITEQDLITIILNAKDYQQYIKYLPGTSLRINLENIIKEFNFFNIGYKIKLTIISPVSVPLKHEQCLLGIVSL